MSRKGRTCHLQGAVHMAAAEMDKKRSAYAVHV